MPDTNEKGPDRDAMTGRLLPGHRLADGNKGGNPTARRMHEFRRQFTECATPADVQRMYTALTDSALAGDIAAMRLWMEYIVGKPALAVAITNLDPTEPGFVILRVPPGARARPTEGEGDAKPPAILRVPQRPRLREPGGDDADEASAIEEEP